MIELTIVLTLSEGPTRARCIRSTAFSISEATRSSILNKYIFANIDSKVRERQASNPVQLDEKRHTNL